MVSLAGEMPDFVNRTTGSTMVPRYLVEQDAIYSGVVRGVYTVQLMYRVHVGGHGDEEWRVRGTAEVSTAEEAVAVWSRIDSFIDQ